MFVGIEGVLLTRPADTCGVAGVLRGALPDVLPDVHVQAMMKEDLMRADEIFLTSSVRGVLPVGALDERVLRVGPCARAAQAHWRASGFPGAEA